MSIKHTILAGTVALGLALTGCSSPSGGDGGVGAASDEAQAAAEALGIDLDACPTDVTEPIGDTLRVGNTYPQTGPVAPGLGPLGPAIGAAVENFNEESELDTTLELTQLDDEFLPDKALNAAQTLLDRDNVDVMLGVIGTPQVAAVRDLLDAECVPLITGVSAGNSANQPEEFPWTTAWTQPYDLDARIMMTHVGEQYPDGAKVAVLYSNTESGTDGLAALERYAGDNEIVARETLELTEASTPSSQITTLRSSGADVLIALPSAAQCAAVMQEVANQGWDAGAYITSQCDSGTFDVAGAAADGWHVTTYMKDPTRGEYVDDPDVAAYVEAMETWAPDTPINNTSIGGFVYTEPLFEAVKESSDSPLGLSRLGLMTAATSLDFEPRMLKPGIRFKLDGLDDQVAMEASYLSVYDAESQLFEDIELYDFEGQMTE